MSSSALLLRIQSAVRCACRRKDEISISSYAKKLLASVISSTAPHESLKTTKNCTTILNNQKHTYFNGSSTDIQHASSDNAFFEEANTLFREGKYQNVDNILLALSDRQKLLSFLCIQASSRGLLLNEKDFWSQIILEAYNALDNDNFCYAVQLTFSCMFLAYSSRNVTTQPRYEDSKSYIENNAHKINGKNSTFLVGRNALSSIASDVEWRFDSKAVTLYKELNGYVRKNIKNAFFQRLLTEDIYEANFCPSKFTTSLANSPGFISSICSTPCGSTEESRESKINVVDLVWFLRVSALYGSGYDLDTIDKVCKILKTFLSFSSSVRSILPFPQHCYSFALAEYVKLTPSSLFSQPSNALPSCLDVSFSPSSMVSIISSLGFMKFPNPDLVSVVCRNLLPHLSTLSFYQLSILANKLSILGYKDANFCHVLAKAAIEEQTIIHATPKGIALLLSAFNRMSFRDDELLAAASQHIIKYIEQDSDNSSSICAHSAFLLFNAYSLNNVLNVPLLKHLIPTFYRNLYFIPPGLAVMAWHDIVRMGVWVGFLRKAVKEKILRDLDKMSMPSLAAATSLCFSHLGFYDSPLLFILTNHLLTSPHNLEFQRFNTPKSISAANILWRAFYSIQWLASTPSSNTAASNYFTQSFSLHNENEVKNLVSPWKQLSLYALKQVNLDKLSTKRWDVSSSSFHEEIHAALPVELQNDAVFEVSVGPYMLDEVLHSQCIQKWIGNVVQKIRGKAKDELKYKKSRCNKENIQKEGNEKKMKNVKKKQMVIDITI